MKAKLLKKARRKIKMYKRNNTYYVDTGFLVSEFSVKENALAYYRRWVVYRAEEMFGFKPKNRLK